MNDQGDKLRAITFGSIGILLRLVIAGLLLAFSLAASATNQPSATQYTWFGDYWGQYGWPASPVVSSNPVASCQLYISWKNQNYNPYNDTYSLYALTATYNNAGPNAGTYTYTCIPNLLEGTIYYSPDTADEDIIIPFSIASSTLILAKNMGSPPEGSCQGDPCNAGNGNNTQHEVDYSGEGVYPLRGVRTYNSGGGTQAPVPQNVWGAQWTGYYDRSIPSNIFAGTFQTVVVNRPDGKVFTFALTNGAYVGDSDVVGTLVELGVDGSGKPTGWTYLNEKDELETYNASGHLISITNRAGLSQTLTYSDGTTGPNGGYVLSSLGVPTATALPAGLLIRVTDPSGRTLQYGYDVVGRVVLMTDPANKTYLYTYSDATTLTANLTSVKYPDGNVRSYLYDEAANVSSTPNPGVSYVNALTGIIDENGNRFASWTYDANGLSISSEHGSFGSGIDHVGLSYGTVSNGVSTTTVTDPLGTVRTYNFNTILGVVKNTGITGQPCNGCTSAFTYDVNGNVASRTDFNGNLTTYQYDLTRNLETSRTEASGLSVARTITTQWSTAFRLPTLVTEPGRTTGYAYDPTSGNLLTQTVTDTTGGGSRTWTYTYTTSADSTLLNLLKAVKGPRTDVSSITTLGYYSNGDLKTVTDALGHVTTITSVDAAGRPLSITDPNGIVTGLTYTPRGWLASRKVGALTTLYTYNGTGQLTQITLPDGSYLSYTYDVAHRLTDITDTVFDRVHYTLDNAGNRIKENVYNSAGVVTETKSRVFNSLNRLAQDIRSYNTTTSYATTYSYDNNGNLTNVLDANNNATIFNFDALNRISQMTDAASGTTQLALNPLDQLTGVTDPKSLNTAYAVSALGNQTQISSPDSGTTNRTFDSAGNLLSATDARGIAATYAYDILNRPVSASYPTTGENVTLTWDAGTGCSYGVGRICQVSDSDGTTGFAYDDQGNMVKKTRTESGVNLVTQYVYDAANRLDTVMTPTGETLVLTRDLAGHILQVGDTSSAGTTTMASNIKYDGTGKVTSQTLGNGTTQSAAYNLSGQPINESAVIPSGVTTGGGDVPTLPEWGEILLGSLLMLQVLRRKRQTTRRSGVIA